MKKYIFLFSLLFLFGLAFGQKWEHIYGYPGTDESFKDIIECYDKGYMITGSYEQEEGSWLIKTDMNGEIIWDKVLKWDDVLVFNAKIAQGKSGTTYITSIAYSDAVGYWPMITKLDSCGEKVWCRVFPNYNYELGWYDDILVLENQDVIALAYFDTSAGNFDQVFLDYIDSEGNLKWRQVYASQENYPHIRSANGDGIKKYGNNYIIHGQCYYPYPSNPSHVFQRPLFIMTDSLFNEQWIIPFGISDSIVGKGFQTIAINDSLYMGVGVRRLEGIKQNSLMMYFNDKGEELGFVQIQNESIQSGLISNQIHDIAWKNDSLFLASVNFGFEDSDWPWGEMVIDTAGNIYKYAIRPPNTSGWTKMLSTYDGKYTIGCGWHEGKTDWDIYMYKINEDLEQDTIYPGNYTYDSLCPRTIQSGTINLSDCVIITDVGETPTPQKYYAGLQGIRINAYPNPANGDEITFGFQNTEYHQDMKLQCFNVLGELVHKEKIYQYQGAGKINILNWKPGMYVALIFSNGKIAGKTKFVVQ